jgi:SAM-dependent methyltransferase
MIQKNTVGPPKIFFLLFAPLGLLILSFLSGISAASEQKQEELTIRNFITENVAYEIAPAVGGGQRIAKSIAPGVVHTFRVRSDQDIFFRRAGKEVSCRLNAGRQYAFHYNVNHNLDIYQDSRGWSEGVNLAPFVPTPLPVVNRMLALAQINANSVVYDLGCGDGRIVIAAAKKYGARGVGIDLDAELVQTARVMAKIEGVEDLVEFWMGDATQADIRPATVVALYLLPESNALLRDRLEQQLRPGAVVVSHNYIIPGWEAKEFKRETVKTEDGQEHRIFLYRR